MAEQYANNFKTTLATAIAAADTSLTLASVTGTGIGTAPTAPFRIRIDDELILVTSRSGTTCTIERGIEGTTAADHAAGTVIRAVLTVAGLNQAIIERLPSSGPAQNTFLVSGGQVVWQSAYTFLVSAATYFINGILYTSPQTSITLSSSHATLDRIDAIVVTTSSTAVAVEGTAAAQPSEPDVDPATQLKIAIVLVTAASSAPTGVSTVSVYAENLGSGSGEWDWTTSGASFNVNSTTNPRTGSKDIEGTALTANHYAQGQKGSGTVDPSTINHIVFYMRSKAGTWHQTRSIVVELRNAGVLKGAVVVGHGSFGFDSTNTTTYQQIAIPMSLFAMTSLDLFNQIRIRASGSSGTAIGMYIDDVSYQIGGATQAPPGLTQEQADARYAPLNSAYAVIGSADGTLPNERRLTAGSGITLTDGGAGSTLSIAASGAAAGKRVWGCIIGDGVNVISTGVAGYLPPIPFAGTITKVSIMVCDPSFTSGSIVVDIWKDTFANRPPTDADSITAAAPPTLSSATGAQDSTLTGWTTAVAVDNVFGFNVDSVSGVKQVAVIMEIQ